MKSTYVRVGVLFFGGDGMRGLIRNIRSTAGVIRPWRDEPSPNGIYTVDRDCTGSFFDADGTRSNNVVEVEGGKRFFLLSVAPGTKPKRVWQLPNSDSIPD